MTTSEESRRYLPFALPNVGSEEEEVIAVLSYVAVDLLAAHYRTVARLRARAERVALLCFAAALATFALFLAQDFERAPIPQLIVLGIVPLLALLVGVGVRVRLADPARFEGPRIVRAHKLCWQWVAMALDREQMILWDTLTDEGFELALPPEPPKRQDWLLRDSFGPLQELEEEKRLIRLLSDHLDAWQAPSLTVRLPVVGDHEEALLTFFRHIPRGRHWEPAPLLPPARSLEEGQDDLRDIMHLHRGHRFTLRQMEAWQEALPHFSNSVERNLRAALPHMNAPPPPPSAHPSADVEALRSTLETVRSGPAERLRETLAEALRTQEEQLERQLTVLEQDWTRERKNVTYTNETLIHSLQRQMEDMKGRALPEAESAFQEGQAKEQEAQQRVTAAESELAEKRKQLLLAGSGSSDTPRASDERKRQLSSEIDRLTSTLPEMKRSVTTMKEVVEFQRAAMMRVQRQLDALQAEHQQYVDARDRELERIDAEYEVRQGALREQYAPLTTAIEADLTYFEKIVPRFADALEPFRADLIMEDALVRPYSQVVQQADRLIGDKQEAVRRWAATVRAIIDERRETIREIVERLDEAALPNIGVRDARIMLVPVWFVEAEAGQQTLWPWQRHASEPRSFLLAPFEEAGEEDGRRVALPEHNTPMRPIPSFQSRLDALRQGPRWEEVWQEARRAGRAVPFPRSQFNEMAHSTQMPRGMIELLGPLQRPQERLPEEESDVPPDTFQDPARAEPLPPDAWQDAAAPLPPEEEDAWHEPPGGPGLPDEELAGADALPAAADRSLAPEKRQEQGD